NMKTILKTSLLLLFVFYYYHAACGIENDTSRINTLLTIGANKSISADSTLKNINEALALAKNIHDDKWLFDANFAKSKWYATVKMNNDSALFVLRELITRKAGTK
ncbi:MAG: hypothetical protein ABI855_17780, partial [Bacteroidota bacterium]